MPKTKISEFSATPANNTDIDSINIAEGCAPSGINDAIRELMSQLKDFQTGAQGDSFNGPIGSTTPAAGVFTTLSASSTTTLSGLTASTALALDASKNIVSVTNTGTGSNVLATSPTLVTPTLGVATATSLQGIIGNVTPAAGTFTTVTGSNDASLNGLTVGRGAGAVSTNTAVGASALAANTTGATNVAVGYQAGVSNTTGTANVFLGLQSAYWNTTGSSNVSLGYAAFSSNNGSANGTGSFNVAVGRESLANNTTASNNTAVGYQAEYSNTTSTQNVAVGYQALYSATTNGNNVAVGYQAGYSLTTGSGNNECVYVGTFAGYSTTNGYYNTAVGLNALKDNTTGYQNTAVGTFALTAITTGLSNTGIGNKAGTAITTGLRNTAVGESALLKCTTANSNTIMGRSAGESLTTGASNTFVGAYNDSVGGCGELVTTGSKNTILGAYNGNQGSLDIRTSSNYIVVSDGDGNPRAYQQSTGGWFQHNNSASWSTTSDARIKENVETITNGLNVVMALRPVEFDYIISKQHTAGFIAQEYEAVLPDQITENVDIGDELKALTNGEPVKVIEQNLVPYLVKAIQELEARIKQLEGN